VPGIGDKGASALLQQYGSLESIIEHIDELKPKIAESLREHEQQARDSKHLATIVRDAPVTLDLEESRARGFDHYRVIELLRELEFRRLLDTLAQVEVALGVTTPPTIQVTEEPAQAETPGGVTAPKGTHQMPLFSDGDNPEGATIAPPAPAKLTDARRSTASALLLPDERKQA